MKIRKTDLKDLPALSEIEKKCFLDCRNEKALFSELEMPYSLYFTAEENGKTAGYLSGYLVCGQLDIMRLAVLPDFRRKGIAEALIKEAAAHCERITLEVRESNIPALSLYKKTGFTVDCVRKDYYSSPTENAVLMSLNTVK